MTTEEPTTKELAATPQPLPESVKVVPLPGLSFLLTGSFLPSDSLVKANVLGGGDNKV